MSAAQHGLWNQWAVLWTQNQGSFWLPVQASTFSPTVDWLFRFITLICGIFFVLIIAFLVVFVIRYREREGHQAQKTPHHNLPLELTWSIIPLILVILIFYWGFRGYMDLANAPQNAVEIQVTGQRWNWIFTYPNGVVDANLRVPVNEPVRLVLTSEDVIHSLFIPAFRLKMDAVPGRYHKVWFHATQAGEYDLFCAEYCGTKHSDMYAKVFVYEPGEYERWLREASDPYQKDGAPVPLHVVGEHFFKTRGCAQCHTPDGKAGIGPTFRNLFGEQQRLRGGGTIQVDENYLRESIVEPQAKVVLGFDPVMPKIKLSDRDITALIEYIKSLSAHTESTAGGES